GIDGVVPVPAAGARGENRRRVEMRNPQLVEIGDHGHGIAEREPRVELNAVRRPQGWRARLVHPARSSTLVAAISGMVRRILRLQPGNRSIETPGTFTGSVSPPRSSSE